VSTLGVSVCCTHRHRHGQPSCPVLSTSLPRLEKPSPPPFYNYIYIYIYMCVCVFLDERKQKPCDEYPPSNSLNAHHQHPTKSFFLPQKQSLWLQFSNHPDRGKSSNNQQIQYKVRLVRNFEEIKQLGHPSFRI
jgi:hypothetical protein